MGRVRFFLIFLGGLVGPRRRVSSTWPCLKSSRVWTSCSAVSFTSTTPPPRPWVGSPGPSWLGWGCDCCAPCKPSTSEVSWWVPGMVFGGGGWGVHESSRITFQQVWIARRGWRMLKGPSAGVPVYLLGTRRFQPMIDGIRGSVGAAEASCTVTWNLGDSNCITKRGWYYSDLIYTHILLLDYLNYALGCCISFSKHRQGRRPDRERERWIIYFKKIWPPNCQLCWSIFRLC